MPAIDNRAAVGDSRERRRKKQTLEDGTTLLHWLSCTIIIRGKRTRGGGRGSKRSLPPPTLPHDQLDVNITREAGRKQFLHLKIKSRNLRSSSSSSSSLRKQVPTLILCHSCFFFLSFFHSICSWLSSFGGALTNSRSILLCSAPLNTIAIIVVDVQTFGSTTNRTNLPTLLLLHFCSDEDPLNHPQQNLHRNNHCSNTISPPASYYITNSIQYMNGETYEGDSSGIGVASSTDFYYNLLAWSFIVFWLFIWIVSIIALVIA